MIANLTQMLARSANAHSTKPALVEGTTQTTYSELAAAASSGASRLIDEGIVPGDRVAILLGNSSDYAIAYFAAQAAGATVVLVNSRLSAHEILHVVSDSGAAILLTSPDFQDRIHFDGQTRVLEVKEISKAAAVDLDLNSLPGAQREPEDVANLLYTSGTTGSPKGAMQTHANLLNNVEIARSLFEFTSADRTLIVAPLFHATGINSQLIAFVATGGTCVIAGAFHPKNTIVELQEQRISVFAGVSTMIELMALSDRFGSEFLTDLRLVAMGGSPVPESTIHILRTRLPKVDVVNVWGMTEATSIVTAAKNDGYFRHPRSAGRAVPGVELAVLDEQGEFNNAPGAVGELAVRGPVVTKGYFNSPTPTAATFVDGWLHTGDVGRIDPDGYVEILDRLKDMIIRGGENIYCLEVENALIAHPDVVEAAVLGVPDQIFGERVRAVVVVKAGQKLDSEALTAHAATMLADYKIPVEYQFVEALPRNPSGKVLKRALVSMTEPA